MVSGVLARRFDISRRARNRPDQPHRCGLARLTGLNGLAKIAKARGRARKLGFWVACRGTSCTWHDDDMS